jgi:hypothetical protein
LRKIAESAISMISMLRKDVEEKEAAERLHRLFVAVEEKSQQVEKIVASIRNSLREF